MLTEGKTVTLRCGGRAEINRVWEDKGGLYRVIFKGSPESVSYRFNVHSGVYEFGKNHPFDIVQDTPRLYLVQPCPAIAS